MGEILRYANAVGALAALTQGVIPALPTADQVDVGGFREARARFKMALSVRHKVGLQVRPVLWVLHGGRSGQRINLA